MKITNFVNISKSGLETLKHFMKYFVLHRNYEKRLFKRCCRARNTANERNKLSGDNFIIYLFLLYVCTQSTVH